MTQFSFVKEPTNQEIEIPSSTTRVFSAISYINFSDYVVCSHSSGVVKTSTDVNAFGGVIEN